MSAPTILPPGAATPPADTEHSVLITRAAEAERIAAFIAGTTARFVVLCGEALSGKTLLVKRWLIPALAASKGRDGYRILYGKCDPTFPTVVWDDTADESFESAMARRSIVLVDDFDLVLDAPRDERRVALDRLFDTLHAAREGAIIVVVVSGRQLTSAYALSSYEPDIVNAVCEIRSLGLAEGLAQLSEEDPASAVVYTDEVLQALRDDSRMLARQGLDASFDLLQFLHERFTRLHAQSGGAIDLTQYRKMGGLAGILREHVDRTLEPLEADRPGASEIARALLNRIASEQSRGATPDLTCIAPQFGVPDDDVRAVLAQLTAANGLLTATRNGQYLFRPPQLIAIVEEDAASSQLQNERAQRIVDEALRSWQVLGTFLPRPRFAELHRQRRHLVLGDELNRFLLQCALRHGDAELAGAPAYWLRRVASRDDAIDALLAAAFDSAAEVRIRAAKLLGDFPDPLVRERLGVLALTDPSADVRAAAVASLSHMPDDELLERLLREARQPKSSHREHAVEALRIFARPEVTSALCTLVYEPDAEPSLRETAIAVLGVQHTQASIDALAGIALHDSACADRDAAGKALASITSEDLNRYLLSRLDWRRPSARIVVAGALVVLAAAGASIAAFLILPIPMLGSFTGSPALLLALAIGLPVATRLALDQLAGDRWSRRSPKGVLAIVLYALSAILVMPWMHGVGHMIVRRTRRGLFLIGLEALGIVLFTVVASATAFVPGIGFIANFYRLVGAALFFGTYVYDLVEVTLGTFVLRGATAREERRSAIYGAVFRNPAMTSTVFSDLRSTVPSSVRRAKSLIAQFGDKVSSSTLVQMFTAADPVYRPHVIRALKRAKDDQAIVALEQQWPGATAEQRRAIVGILASRPTARSSAALRRLASTGGAWARFRAGLVALQFRLALWPRSARLATLCFVPAVAVLLYHGVMILRNHAWGEIVLLRQGLPTSERKVKIVDFLVDVYPQESAPELRRMFREEGRQDVSPVYTALARGLTGILDSGFVDDRDALRAELSAGMTRADSLLTATEPARFDLGLSVLRRMADAADPELSSGAVRSLAAFLGSSAALPDLASRKERVVGAIGELPYARALLTLDSLLRVQRVGKRQPNVDVADMLRGQITQTAKQAYAALPTEASRTERTTLLATLDRLSYPPGDVIAQLKREIDDNAGKCDRNGDNVCDGKDEALRTIAENPDSEDGYRDLYDHYASKNEYTEAETSFKQLRERYPRSIWPLKILSEIYHEHSAVDDVASFARSYAAMDAMRNLDAFRAAERAAPDDYLRIEADYTEIALSAEEYAAAESAAQRVLSRSSDNMYRLNMNLFLYVASVMQHQPDSAVARLTRLEAVIRTLGSDYSNNWVYPGTIAFIQHSDLAPRLKQALIGLCKEGDWYTQSEAAAKIAANRAALKTLTPSSPSTPER